MVDTVRTTLHESDIVVVPPKKGSKTDGINHDLHERIRHDGESEMESERMSM